MLPVTFSELPLHRPYIIWESKLSPRFVWIAGHESLSRVFVNSILWVWVTFSFGVLQVGDVHFPPGVSYCCGMRLQCSCRELAQSSLCSSQLLPASTGSCHYSGTPEPGPGPLKPARLGEHTLYSSLQMLLTEVCSKCWAHKTIHKETSACTGIFNSLNQYSWNVKIVY